ncbi:MAG: hypothetical protein WC529_01335 [Candidatus Margulisiibacteriota bacterium]
MTKLKRLNDSKDIIRGSIVKLVLGRRDPGEGEEKYRVVEDNGNRIVIELLNSSMQIIPQQTVLKSDVMLADSSGNVDRSEVIKLLDQGLEVDQVAEKILKAKGIRPSDIPTYVNPKAELLEDEIGKIYQEWLNK